jgi:hypothetical protein
VKTIFQNQKFISKGVANTIPLFLQIIMWELIKNVPVDCDYLQVFSLSSENGKQKIIHTQEVPEHKKEYVIDADMPVTAKVFVIDDETHSTMLLAEEY